jgi:hypothetical protein
MATARIATLVGALIMAVIIAAGCSSGGKGGGDDQVAPVIPPPVQPPPAGTAIKGTVPGTIIHAIGDDGSYYWTETKPADPAPRPFNLLVKPGIGYRLVLEEAGAFYPVRFDSPQGSTNRFYMSVMGQALDLGQITPNPISGIATPQHNPLDSVDTDGDGTVDRNDPDFVLPGSDALDVDGDGIPNFLDPTYTAASNDSDGDGIPDGQDFDIDNDGVQNVDDSNADGVGGGDSPQVLLQRAFAQVVALNALGAYQSFQDIVDREPTHQLGNFGLAITRIAAVLTNLNPGTDSSKLDTMKEILDRAGFSPEGRDLSNFTASLPTINRTIYGYSYFYTVSCVVWSNDTPTPNELRAYLNERLVPQIKAALDHLNVITPGFRFTLPRPIVIKGTSVSGEVDYGDVSALKAALHGVLAFLTLLNAYDIEFDLDDLVNNARCAKVDPTTYHSISAQAFAERYPNLGTLSDGYASALSDLKAHATAMMDDAIAAMDTVHNETDVQSNDLVTIDPLTFASDRAFLEQIKASLNGEETLSFSDGRTLTLNLAPIFAGIHLRSYLPTLMGNQAVYASIRAAGYDSTFGGVLPLMTAEDIVRFVDRTPPNVRFVGLSQTMLNPITFQVQADDEERLPDDTMQRGSGVDPGSFSLWWNCSPSSYPPSGFNGCTLSGQTSAGPMATTSYYWDITEFLGPPSSTDGVVSWTPNGGSVTVNTGGASSAYNSMWVQQVRDRAGNYRWYTPTSFTVE